MADIKIIVDSSDVATATNRVDQLGSSGTVAQKGIDKAARGMNQFGTVAKNGGKKLNTFNMQIQQGGYQLQDFVVQLQSGTSFFTAFGQQGSQFAGVFGPQGAVIGAVIAIGSAIGGIGYRALTAASAVKDFKEQLEDTSSVMEEYISLASKADETFAGLFDSSMSAISLTSQAAKDLLLIAKTDALDSIRGLGKSLSDASTEAGFWASVMFNTDRVVTGNLLNIDTQLKGNITTWKQTGQQVQAFIDAVRGIESAESLDGMYQSALLARDLFKETVDVTGEMTEKQKAFWKELSTTILKLEMMGAASQAIASTWADFDLGAFGGEGPDIKEQERLKTAVTETGELRIKLAFRRQKLFDAFRDRQRKAEREEQDALEKIAVAQEKRFSSQKESLQLRMDEANLQELYKDKFYIQNLMERKKILLQQQSGEITAEQAKELLKLTDELGDQQEKLRKINEQEKARLDLIQLQTDLENKRGRALDKLTGGNKEFFDPRNESGVSGVIFRDRDKPDSKKEPVVKESDLEKLRSQLDLEDALLGKTEARQRVIQALGVDFVKNNPKTVAGLEAQITANENLLRIEEERKRMNDLVTDSMENGLMAMADGTKSVSDAFRDMAREIIAELYRILVVQQMVNAAKSFFGFPFADGGAFSGGSQIQAYADGGVVGSPTLFPMAGGKTGLMGEAGPEAIMPLKRGANGKLGVQMEGGGGDNVVINQSFNFQANGDDSVKKIIAQAAPQIAQMTKNSMLNDRRRGGTTKAVFG